MTETRKGLLYGILAHGLWGVIAVYWKLLAEVDAVEVTAHRALWGFVAFGLIAVLAGQGTAVRTALRDRRTIALMGLSGALLAFNWGVFVWATATGHLLEASLGYFINPLVAVAFGTLYLREQLSRMHWLAIVLAAIGVGYLTWRGGRIPYVGLSLAITFGMYGLVRKIARVDALAGSTIETGLMAPIAAVFLVAQGGGAIGHVDATTTILLFGTGFVTAVPLMLFTSAAKRLPLSTLGFLQYLTPTGNFLLAVLAYHERLAPERLFAFTMIWIGCVVFSIDLWRRAKRNAM